MQYYPSAEAVQSNIDFIEDGEFYTPDVGSVTYTLLDNQNVAISGQTSIVVTTTASTTNVVLNIGAAYNIKSSLKDFENRTIHLKGTVGGKPFAIRSRYRLIDSALLILDPNNVRVILGVSDSELPDEDIDVFISYFKYANKYGDTFKNAFSQGDISALYAESVVYLETAINAVPALRLKVAQTESDGVVRFSRFTNIDWDSLLADLKSKLEEALLTVGVSTEETIVGGFLGSSIDYFPGA